MAKKQSKDPAKASEKSNVPAHSGGIDASGSFPVNNAQATSSRRRRKESDEEVTQDSFTDNQDVLSLRMAENIDDDVATNQVLNRH